MIADTELEVKTMRGPLKRLWDLMIEPFYGRLFRRFFLAGLTRLDTLLEEAGGIREELRALRSDLSGAEQRIDRLDTHVRTAIAGGWESTALARRLAAIEDRLDVEHDGASAGAESRAANQL